MVDNRVVLAAGAVHGTADCIQVLRGFTELSISQVLAKGTNAHVLCIFARLMLAANHSIVLRI